MILKSMLCFYFFFLKATSALDAESEALVQEAIDCMLKRGRTQDSSDAASE